MGEEFGEASPTLTSSSEVVAYDEEWGDEVGEQDETLALVGVDASCGGGGLLVGIEG